MSNFDTRKVVTRVDEDRVETLEISQWSVRDILIIVRDAAHRCALGDVREVEIDWQTKEGRIQVKVRK